MTIIVRRTYNLNDVHSMSVVVDEDGVEYVLPTGKSDSVLTPERPAMFSGEFVEEFGREPQSPEDWAECAVYNLGWVSISDPVDNSYNTKAAAVKSERLLIDKSREDARIEEQKAKVFSDADMSIGPKDSLAAFINPEDGSVVALTLTFAREGGNSDFLYYRVDGKWTNDPEVDILDEDMNYEMDDVTVDYISAYDENRRNRSDIATSSLAAAAAAPSCPPATQDIVLNIKNRQNAIDNVGYGPMNPDLPSEEFWQAKADRWSVDQETAKQSLCGNCVMFIRTPSMLDCIASGITEGGSDVSGGWDTIDAAELGYCDALDFKCAASRTCDAWVVGGPITEEKK
jgi:hypothetical protein